MLSTNWINKSISKYEIVCGSLKTLEQIIDFKFDNEYEKWDVCLVLALINFGYA